MPLLEVRGLAKTFRPEGGLLSRAGGPRLAVDGVSLDIEAGETLGLVGESGCGKTTLGRMILRLTSADSGSVRFAGEDVLAASGDRLRKLRREMQIVFQDPFGSLDPRMTVEQIVTEPLVIHGEPDGSGSGRKAADLLLEVGLDATALSRYPHEFSGGQRQRIGIARALALRPRFLVLDEPVSALDVSVGAQIVNLLRDLQRAHGLTYLFISHSMPVVRYLATRIAVMQQGRIVETGPAEEICARPREEYTKTLLAAVPEISYS